MIAKIVQKISQYADFRGIMFMGLFFVLAPVAYGMINPINALAFVVSLVLIHGILAYGVYRLISDIVRFKRWKK